MTPRCHFLHQISHLSTSALSVWITQSFWLEGTSPGLLSSLLLNTRLAMRSDQVAQSFIQLHFENLLSFSEHPASLFDWPHEEKGFFPIYSEPLFFQLMPVVSHLPTLHHAKEPRSVFFITSSYVQAGCCLVTPEPLLLQAEVPQLPKLLLTRQVLQPLHHLGNTPLYLLKLIDICLVPGGSTSFCLSSDI